MNSLYERLITISTCLAVIVIITALATALAMADDLILAKEHIRYEDYGGDLEITKQLLTVKNNTSGTVAVVIQCDFWQRDKLLDGGRSVTIGNVKPGQSGYDLL